MRSPDGRYANLAYWDQSIPGIYKVLEDARAKAYTSSAVCPPKELCLAALEMVPPQDVRVVILGQDPYHTPGKANGLSFGYHPNYTGGLDSPLLNIVTELGSNPDSFDRTLLPWARQGVLLLNTRLSVLEGQPMSHAYGADCDSPTPGWERPINALLKFLRDSARQEIFWLLWGTEARRLAENASVDLWGRNVMVTSHPGKLSNNAGPIPFTGSNCFQKANDYLISIGKEPIIWSTT